MEGNQTLRGLTSEQVEQNRKRFGSNVLTPPEKEPVWKLFLDKFADPIIRILLIALLLSVGVSVYRYTAGDGIQVLLEPLGIFFAIILSTGVGFVFELSANRKFEVLNQINDDEPVKVKRDGCIITVPRRDVVVGDVVLLEAGEEVPGDAELHVAVSLQVNESDLTGEPVAHKTTIEADFDHEATYPSNMVMKGTKVVEGHCVAVVTKVGDSTEWGRVYKGAQIDNKVKTPLNNQLNKLANIITVASYIVAGLIVAFRLIDFFIFGDGEPFAWIPFVQYLLNTFMIAVTIIVVAVPEGLPMSVTLSLALSMKRMLSANNLVRKMHACETMGATTVICTDKTGTLTQNRMHVAEHQLFDRDFLHENIAINSTAFIDSQGKPIGNPTEAALLLWSQEEESDYLGLRSTCRIIEQMPFSTHYKYMATIAECGGQRVLLVKGAPEVVLGKCNLTDAGMESIQSRLIGFQNKAMRTLALAYKVVGEEPCLQGTTILADNLTLTGVFGIADPIRHDVASSIAQCRDAGIDIKIVTGDTFGTAREIGRQLGLWTPADDGRQAHLTGVEFARFSDDELLERVDDLKILSRARPMDKERLVGLLQRRNEVVAVTGDGTNDAPALKKAQVGLSMGDGTSVAKEASDITILDNSFTSIARAVMWGRSLYINIQRFVLFQMTINVAACLIVLIGSMVGTESPLTVTQMLWVNLIMDTFAAMALASLPPERKVMNDKPRSSDAHIVTRHMAYRIFGVGLFFVVVLFGLLQYFKHFEITSLTGFSLTDFGKAFFRFDHVNSGLSAYELSLFFTFFVFMQFWNIFNAKAFSTGRSAFANMFSKSAASGFGLALAIIFFGQIAIVTFGGPMFNVVPLPLADWLIIVSSTSVILWVGELVRMTKKIRYGFCSKQK